MEKLISWEDLCEVQSLYFGEAYQYIKNTPHKILKEKFMSLDSCNSVLRLLGSFQYTDIKDVIDALFEDIVEFSIDGNPTQIVLARKIIESIDRKFLNEKLEGAFQKVINKEEDDDSSHLFRNIAHLLQLLGFKSLLSKFLNDYCKGSASPDIEEIFIDFNL